MKIKLPTFLILYCPKTIAWRQNIYPKEANFSMLLKKTVNICYIKKQTKNQDTIY